MVKMVESCQDKISRIFISSKYFQAAIETLLCWNVSFLYRFKVEMVM